VPGLTTALLSGRSLVSPGTPIRGVVARRRLARVGRVLPEQAPQLLVLRPRLRVLDAQHVVLGAQLLVLGEESARERLEVGDLSLELFRPNGVSAAAQQRRPH
jgi:hypothetical protein